MQPAILYQKQTATSLCANGQNGLWGQGSAPAYYQGIYVYQAVLVRSYMVENGVWVYTTTKGSVAILGLYRVWFITQYYDAVLGGRWRH